MAAKAKKTTKNKKPAAKTTTKKTVAKKPAIKSSVTGKCTTWEKPAIGKIVCLCVGVIAILVVIVAIMFNDQLITGDYFVSDSKKYVLNVPAEDNENGAVATHAVYFYEGDTITGIKYFYEFTDNTAARAFYDMMMEAMDPEGEDKKDYIYVLNGKYVIAVADKEEYSGLSASDIKSYIDLYEKYSNGDLTENTESEESEESEE